MQYFIDVLTLTLTATGTFDAFDVIGFDDAKVTTDDAPVKAIAKNPATAIGDDVAGLAIGVARVRADGVILQGAKVMSAAGGGVKTASADPANPIGHALTAAADGEFVSILKL